MWIIHLKPTEFPNEEEHFPIDQYFYHLDASKEYEMAIIDLHYATPGTTDFYVISSNIIDYNVFNPDKILLRFCELTKDHISPPVFYKIDVTLLKNLRIKVNGFKNRQLALSLAIREING